MSLYRNPFEPQTDRHALWHMLVEQDIEAFVQADWDRVKGDFIEVGFSAIDAHGSDNPDTWRLSFRTLREYEDQWLAQARDMGSKAPAETLRRSLIEATTLRDIEIEGDSALLHKKFDGEIPATDGKPIPLHWQTLYQCVKIDGKWRIAGFVGYLPNPMGSNKTSVPARQLPPGADQHVTAGPYSPVLIVNPGQLVVISGQAAIKPDGSVALTTIEEQALLTLQNCEHQLAAAGCTFKDVFKTNVYMTDLSAWEAFNTVYKRIMPVPRPVRTTVGTQLLPGLLIEIEMWAVKS